MPASRATNFRIYGVPLLLIVALMTIVPTVLNMFSEVPLDFAAFMMSGRWLRQGLDPYRQLLALRLGNANPPAILLATVPLTSLDDPKAFVLWTIASAVGLFFSLSWISRALKLPLMPLSLVALGLQGVCAAFRFGQMTLPLLPLMTLAFLADREGRTTAAGVWLGALIYAKPFAGVYALYMLWRREFRAVAAITSMYVLLTGIGLLAGIQLTKSWIEMLASITDRTSHVVNASWSALAYRAFNVDVSQAKPVYEPFAVAPAIASTLALGGSLAIGLVSAWGVGRTTNRDVQWAILASAMLLISPLGWMYYIPLLIPALAAVIPTMRHLSWMCVAAAILWVPNSLVARNSFSPLASVTYASPYTWGLLLVWMALCVEAGGRRRPAPKRAYQNLER